MQTGNPHRAELIASAIQANCDLYLTKRITYANWDIEQQRLWTLADAAGVSTDVVRLVRPALTMMVPPYAVRKQLRAKTLKVGR